MKESIESKGLALLRILQIFEKYSDVEHPLTQKDIGDYLERDYGIVIERKNIGRKISVDKRVHHSRARIYVYFL